MRSVNHQQIRLSKYRIKPSRPLALMSLLVPAVGFADLNSISGMTPTQAAAARMIQSVCPRMATDNTQSNLDGNEQILFFRCRELVQSSNQVQGSGPTAFSLNLTEAEIREVLQATAPEEVAAVGNEAADALSGQTGNLTTRMSALRRGGTLSASTVSLFLGDQILSIPTLASRGGGASADAVETETEGEGGNEGHRSFFVNGQLNAGERERTAREDAFDFASAAITLGYDVRLADKGFVGMAVGYNQSKAEIERDGGSIDTTGYALSAYGTHFRPNGVYVDGLLSYGKNDHEFVRNIRYASRSQINTTVSDTISADPSGKEEAAAVTLGRDLEKGIAGFDTGVFARANYLKTSVDRYWENGNSRLELEVKSQEFESLTLAIGGQMSKALSRTYGVLVPQVRAEYIHEFKNDSRNIIARYVYEPYNDGTTLFAAATDEPDRDYAALGAGVSALFQNGGQAFAMYETLVGLENSTHHSISFGVRRELR